LRPWTIDDALDTKIDQEVDRLNDCVQKTSGSKIAGARGMSQLDHKPDMFLDFERFISDPNWLFKLGTAEADAEDERRFAEMVAQAQAAINAEQQESVVNPETNNMALVNPDDKLLLNSILEFNQALYDRTAIPSRSGGARGDVAVGQATRDDVFRAKAEAFQQFIDLRGILAKKNRKKKKKKVNPAYSLDAIKYEGRKSPAVLNVSTVEFQKLMQRFNMTMPAPHTLNKSKSSPLFASMQQTSPGYSDKAMRLMLANSGDKAAFNAGAGADTAQRAKDMDALTQFLAGAQSLEGKRPDTSAAPAAPSASTAASVAAASPSLAPVPENSELDAIFQLKDNDLLRPSTSSPARPLSSSPAAAVGSRPSSSNVRPTSSSFLLRGTEFSAEERALLDANAARVPFSTSTELQLPSSPIERAASARPASRLSKGLDAGGEMLASPSTAAATATAAVVAVVASSPSRNAVLLDPLSSPNKLALLQSPTPRSARPSTSSGGSGVRSLSEARTVARLSTPSQALNKLSISASTGTINHTNSPGTLGKARIQAMRSLRDQLMSTSGSQAMNVHPEASPDAQSDAKESVRVTQQMVKDTIEKNRVDQTWTLLATPGYYEAVGPEKIFASDTTLGFLVNDKFDKAVSLLVQFSRLSFSHSNSLTLLLPCFLSLHLQVRDADVTQGIKKDPLRVWSEDGVKNKIKIFQSGGSMKM
jgi:hypothetical protein